MAVSFSEAGSVEAIEEPFRVSEYLDCVAEAGLTIRMHVDAVDGIARDVVEGNLAESGVEIGGLLLGGAHETDGVTTAHIERYQRLECEHRFGPHFILTKAELDEMEHAAGDLASDSQLTVLGFYRSNIGNGLQLTPSDLEIADRYFPDTGDLAMLVEPSPQGTLRSRFFLRGIEGRFEAVGQEFPFCGKMIPIPAVEIPVPEKPRRLVPDFLPLPEPKPAAPQVMLPSLETVRQAHAEPAAERRRWWPLLGALALVSAVVVFFLLQSHAPEGNGPPPQGRTAELTGPVRPVGLFVDPAGETWRVAWNSGATALQGARSVALFVRDSDDQNRIDLTPQDLQSGTYEYHPQGSARDVTFRLEATDAAGHLTAESFRLVRQAPAAPPVTSAPPAAAAAPPAARSRAIHKVAPVVPASIRPRIHGSMAIDIRVKIDGRGRVVSAVPVSKPRSGLQSFLAERAVAAARQWKFEPGEADETIHFVFER